MMDKPFSQACENNKQPILNVLQSVFTQPCELLEIGSGTGQHAVFLAAHLPHISWQPTEMEQNIPGLQRWIDEAKLNNLKQPITLSVADRPWPQTSCEAVFTANTLHIMSWSMVEVFFTRLGEYLQPAGIFCSYGPFNKKGEYTSASNAQFDQWLHDRDSDSGIRDLEALIELANKNGISLIEDISMPANNQCLIWKKC